MLPDIQPVEDWSFVDSPEWRECEEFNRRWDDFVARVEGAGSQFIGATRHGQAEFWRGGGLVKVVTPTVRGHAVKPPHTVQRGVIRQFSAQSRRRLLRAIATVLKGVLPIFVTLTYPAEWPGDEREWKRHLDAVWKRIRRRWPKASAFWRLEFQKRGAPHFHLLLYNVSWAELTASDPDGRRWLDRAWYEVVGSGDEKHLLAGVRTEKVKSFKGVMFYASKYIAKLPDGIGEDGESGVGRFWGVMGRDTMPWAQRVVYRLIGNEAWHLRRMLARRAGLQVRGRKGLTIFADGTQWERLIQDALLPFET